LRLSSTEPAKSSARRYSWLAALGLTLPLAVFASADEVIE
jgi:hypothetical protein